MAGIGAFTDTDVVIPCTSPNGDSVTGIGEWAFSECTGLTSITIPDSVTRIWNGAFSGCTALTSILVDDNNPVYHSAGNCLIKTDSKTLIAGCKNSIIPTDGSVTSIGVEAFAGCTGLTSITIPNSLTSIVSWVFFGCTGLTSVYYDGTAEEWDQITIGNNNPDLKNATVYYYAPDGASDTTGNYWHYDEDGNPVAW